MQPDRPPHASAANPASDLASIAEVRARVVASVERLAGSESVSLAQARGRVLAAPLIAERSLPVFDHSAMDGYALGLQDGCDTYRLVGRVVAGDGQPDRLQAGEALRIFTGAPIPAGADAVIMQEQVSIAGPMIRPLCPIARGDNIRRAGEDVASGVPLARAGTLLDARHIALAAAVGLAHLDVRYKLRVALLSTGNELATPGEPLADGRIFDSNRPMIAACLERPGVEIIDLGIVRDDRTAIIAAMQRAAGMADLIVTTGGASVGDEDYLVRALLEAGGDIEMARAAIRPGKPFTFGHVLRPGESTRVPIAILPGNPFAALVTTLLFVRPMIEQGLGLPAQQFAPLPAEANFTCPRTARRTEFLPARVTGRGQYGLPQIARLGRGGSARLKPLIEADGLAVIAPGETAVEPGTLIGYLPFGTAFSL